MGRAKSRRDSQGVAAFERHLEVARDADNSRLRDELTSLKRKYEAALKQLDVEKSAVANLTALADVKPKKISARRPTRSKAEATAVLVLSDWHVEERVDPATCRNLNEFTLEIADRRIKQLVQKAAMLIEHERALTGIRRIVVAALGDFLTGHIHDDLVEITQLAPLAARAAWRCHRRHAGDRPSAGCDSQRQSRPVDAEAANGDRKRAQL